MSEKLEIKAPNMNYFFKFPNNSRYKLKIKVILFFTIYCYVSYCICKRYMVNVGNNFIF